MKNVTLSLDEQLLEAAKLAAAKEGHSLNKFVQELIRRAVKPRVDTKNDSFAMIVRELKADSGGWKWNREEAYEG